MVQHETLWKDFEDHCPPHDALMLVEEIATFNRWNQNSKPLCTSRLELYLPCLALLLSIPG